MHFKLIYGLGAIPLMVCASAFATPEHGVDLTLFAPTVDQRVLNESLDNMSAIGVNHLSLNVWWFQSNINSTTIAPNYSSYSTTDDTLRQIIDAAHARSIAVELRPLVDLSADSSHWRGQIVGGNTWFNGANGYGDYMRHMADIAQEKGAERFSVGVELTATQTQETNWRSLITSIRGHYSGPLVYAANWGNPAVDSTVNWWDAVDYMGIDAYYPLTGIANPTLAQLQSAWATRAGSISTYRNSVAPGKSVIFTEAGYMNQDGTNTAPYSYTSGAAEDQQEQADCYQALLSQNWNQSWFGGVNWWSWDIGTTPSAITYDPRGKLAYDVMGSYYVPGYTVGPSWTGSSGSLWNSSGNWSSASVPGSLTTATFKTSGGGSTSVNLGGAVTVARLIFDTSSAAAYTFQVGNTLTFNPGGGITITPQVTTTQTLNCAVALQGPAMFVNGSKTSNQNLIVNGAMSAGSANLARLSLVGDGNGQLNGVISDGVGTIALYKAGNGTWTVSANNSFTGAVDVMAGNLTISSGGALGSSVGSTTVASGASLQMNGGLTVASEPVQISGGGNGGQGAFQLLTGAGTWNGGISTVGDAQIAVRSYNGDKLSNLTIGAAITGGSTTSTLTFRGSNSVPGFVRLGASSSYLGNTYVWGTKLILAGGDNTLPSTTVVDLDTLSRALSLDAGVLDLNGTNQTIAGLTNHAASTQARVVNRAAGTIRTLGINGSGSFTYAGNLAKDTGDLALTKQGAGTQTLSGTNTYTGGTTVSAGQLTFGSVSAVAPGALTATGGTTTCSSGFATAPKITSLSIAIPGKVDLTNDDLVIDYTGGSPIDDVRQSLFDARLFSSSATATTRIGYADNASVGLAAFSGTPVDATSVLIKYTYAGDANLDGQVDVTDLGALATAWQSAGVWTSGDFSYDGFIDVTDLGLLATAWQLGVGSPLGQPSFEAALAAVGLGSHSVPEPGAGIGGLVLCFFAGVRPGLRRLRTF